MKRLKHYLTYAVLAVSLSACAVAPALPLAQRPLVWAQPIQVAFASESFDTARDIPNFFKVSPILYRSAQPLVQGLKGLEFAPTTTLGQAGLPNIRTVLSLRNDAGDAAIFPQHQVRYLQIPINTWNIKEADVIQFLKMVRNPDNQPLLLHCKHGADRTGMMVAVYRIVEQGWSKEAAITEMTQGGFGYHPVWTNLIRYIENMDVERVKRVAHS